jgi:hypothetical protein
MQDVRPGDAVAPELAGVTGIPDFQDPALDIGRIPAQESLNVIAVNGLTPVKTEIFAYRGKPPQISQINSADGRPPGIALQLSLVIPAPAVNSGKSGKNQNA